MNQKLAKFIFFFIEYLRGEKVYHFLKELENNQSMSRDELLTLQKNKLRKLLDHVARNNIFYINKYKGYDVINNFELLPVLTKDELRDNYKNILTSKTCNKLDLVETSGSTGIPLQFYRDRTIFGYTLSSVYRAHRWWGIDVGEKEAMLWGVPVNFKNRLKVKVKDLLLNRFREDQYNINSEVLSNFYKKIEQKRPCYLFGYSSMVYEFALFMKNNGLDLKRFNLKAVICTAEKIYPEQRELIEECIGCRVVSEYGSTETGIISYECKDGSNHIADDCVYVEIVDENNIPLPDGVSGKVLVTVLNSFSSPIIRYELGDISSKSTKVCSCGLNFSVLGDIEGRISNVAVGENGNVYHSIIFYYIFKELTDKFGGVAQYKVYQRNIDEIEFYLVKDNRFTPRAEGFIKSQIYQKFGSSMKIKIIYVKYIERNKSGKFCDFETDIDTSGLLSRIYKNS